MKMPQEGQKPQSHRSTGEFCPFLAHTSSPGQVKGDAARGGGSESMGDQGGGLCPGGSRRWGSSLQFELHPPVFLITPAVTSLVTVTTMS